MHNGESFASVVACSLVCLISDIDIRVFSVVDKTGVMKWQDMDIDGLDNEELDNDNLYSP